MGINNRGQIVLTKFIFSDHGYVFSKGTFSAFDFPGASSTTAHGINDAGQIVGVFSTTKPFEFHGFVFSNGSFWTVDVRVPAQYPLRINNRGQIVGVFLDDSLIPHNFLLNNGSFQTVDLPWALGSVEGINDQGDIVGRADFGGFLLSKGSIETFRFPFGTASWATGINNRGQIVGNYEVGGFQHHGFLLTNGSFETVDFPGAYSTTILGINDRGEIVGRYLDGERRLGHGFLATPLR